MTVEQLNLALLAGPVVLLAAVAAVRLSVGSGFPSLLLYLALGVGIGERGLGVRFDDVDLTAALGYAALVVILAEGGLTTRWRTIRSSVAPAAVLATVGTLVSVAVMGAAAHAVLGLDWPEALLLGAALSSTDAAAVFSVLRRVPLPGRLVGMLEAESGFDDAPVVILVIALTEVARGGDYSIPGLVGLAIFELVVGSAVGLAIGWLGAQVLQRIALPASGLYPIAVLGLGVLAYGASAQVHASGFIAVYLASLVLGNARLPHGAAVRGFAEGVGWIAQIGLFVLLGLLADPLRLPAQIWPALAVGTVLLLIARPLSVVVSVSWFRVPWREQLFLSWAGLRGAVPVVMATIPIAAGVDPTRRTFDLVFVLVVIFTLVQAPTLPWVARRLRLIDPVRTVGLDVESSPLGAQGAEVLEVHVGPESQLHGVEVFELRLPVGANVTLILRDGDALVPSPRTMLRHGDSLIVVCSSTVRDATEDRLRTVSSDGKLARWRSAPLTPAVRRSVGRRRRATAPIVAATEPRRRRL